VILSTGTQTRLTREYLPHMENLCTYITAVALSAPGAKAKAKSFGQHEI